MVVEADPGRDAAAEEAGGGEQDQEGAGDDEEDGEQPEVRQAVDLLVVVHVRLHRRDERLVVGKTGGHLQEDADVLAHRAEQAVEVLPHGGQVLQHRRHRRELRGHQRLHLCRRHVECLREDRHELRGIGLHAAEPLQVAVELRQRRRAEHRRDLAERHEHLVVVVGRCLDLIRLHDRLEAVQHPLACTRLRRQREGKRRNHEREPDQEDGPEYLAIHHDLLCPPQPRRRLHSCHP